MKTFDIRSIRRRKTVSPLQRTPTMVTGFRAIQGREIAQMLAKSESQIHPKTAARNASILVEKLGLVNGEIRTFEEIAEKHKLGVDSVRLIFQDMLYSAMRNDEIRTEILALAGVNGNLNQLVDRLLKRRRLADNKKIN